MATQIGRGTPTADININGASYRGQSNFFSIRCLTPQLESSVFSDEPNTSFEPGDITFLATFSMLLKQGAGAWLAFFPGPQKVPSTFTFATNATVGGVWSYDDVMAARPVNANATLAGTARSSGVVVVTWV